jgi:hypothetical protein
MLQTLQTPSRLKTWFLANFSSNLLEQRIVTYWRICERVCFFQITVYLKINNVKSPASFFEAGLFCALGGDGGESGWTANTVINDITAELQTDKFYFLSTAEKSRMGGASARIGLRILLDRDSTQAGGLMV